MMQHARCQWAPCAVAGVCTQIDSYKITDSTLAEQHTSVTVQRVIHVTVNMALDRQVTQHCHFRICGAVTDPASKACCWTFPT